MNFPFLLYERKTIKVHILKVHIGTFLWTFDPWKPGEKNLRKNLHGKFWYFFLAQKIHWQTIAIKCCLVRKRFLSRNLCMEKKNHHRESEFQMWKMTMADAMKKILNNQVLNFFLMEKKQCFQIWSIVHPNLCPARFFFNHCEGWEGPSWVKKLLPSSGKLLQHQWATSKAATLELRKVHLILVNFRHVGHWLGGNCRHVLERFLDHMPTCWRPSASRRHTCKHRVCQHKTAFCRQAIGTRRHTCSLLRLASCNAFFRQAIGTRRHLCSLLRLDSCIVCAGRLVPEDTPAVSSGWTPAMPSSGKPLAPASWFPPACRDCSSTMGLGDLGGSDTVLLGSTASTSMSLLGEVGCSFSFSFSLGVSGGGCSCARAAESWLCKPVICCCTCQIADRPVPSAGKPLAPPLTGAGLTGTGPVCPVLGPVWVVSLPVFLIDCISLNALSLHSFTGWVWSSSQSG